MLKTGKRINSRREFAEEFKLKLVEDYEKGLMSVLQMERHYGISNKSIYKWIYKYSTYNSKNFSIVEKKDSQTYRLKALEEKVRELERAVGQKQIKIDYLEKLIDLAKETYSIDFKKKLQNLTLWWFQDNREVMSYSLNKLYQTLGVSKQSVQQSRKRQECFDRELSELVVLADLLKDEHPGCGVEKMYRTLNPLWMGRDKFCEIFLELGYGVKRVRNYHRTTYSGDLYYPNLIEGMNVTRPFQVVQSDITYFNLGQQHYYLVFIIDVYTRWVVGYAVNDHMRAEANISAFQMASKLMACQPYGTIHHSDRGSQYGSHAYTKLLKEQKIYISMGFVAWENAYAERINGIIKNEYLNRWVIKDFKDLKVKVAKAVNHYNDKRLHRAFNMDYTPREFYQKLVDLPTQERPTVTIYTEGRKNFEGASSPIEVYPREEPLAHNCPRELNKC